MKRATREIRLRLKRPLGILIEGNRSETPPKILRLLKKLKPTKVVAVGDVVTESLFEMGIKPEIYLIDGKSLRSPLTGAELGFDKVSKSKLKKIESKPKRGRSPDGGSKRKLDEGLGLLQKGT